MKEDKTYYRFVTLWQYLGWIVAYIPLRLIFPFAVSLPNIDDASVKPQMIIANHKSMLDPWFISHTLPMAYYKKIAPILPVGSQSFQSKTFMIFFKFFIRPFIYYPYGTIMLPPIKPNKDLSLDDKVKVVIDEINKSRVVAIFPEGKLRKNDGVHPFKRGSSHIQKVTNVPIMPIALKFEKRFTWLPGSSWWLPWTRRRTIWGKKLLYIPEEIRDDDEQASEWLRLKVEELYNS